jgi:hypothetical protein
MSPQSYANRKASWEQKHPGEPYRPHRHVNREGVKYKSPHDQEITKAQRTAIETTIARGEPVIFLKIGLTASRLRTYRRRFLAEYD